MIYRNVLIAFGLIFTLGQLSPVVVDWPIPYIAYGNISERFQELSVSFFQYTQLAKRAVALTPEYNSIIFVGDILLARNVEFLMKKNSEEYPFAGLSLKTLGSRPAVVGNFESSMLKSHVATPAYHMKFSVDGALLDGLGSAGFTHLSLANNHSLDFGQDAYSYAIEALTENDFETFGHATDLNEQSLSYIKTNRGAVALIGIHASTREPDYDKFKLLMEEASEKSYLQIVYIHWGAEYILIHNKVQSHIAQKLIDNGVDLIIGHHPHVVQDVALIDDVVVFYSLGNYIFDQYFSKDVQQGLVVALDVDEVPTLNLFPVSSETTLSQPKLMEPQQHSDFLQELAKRSDPALKEAILQGKIPLPRMVATSTEIAIMVQ